MILSSTLRDDAADPDLDALGLVAAPGSVLLAEAEILLCETISQSQNRHFFFRLECLPFCWHHVEISQ